LNRLTNEEKNKNEARQDKKYCVYMHTNKINDKKYIGITSMKKPEHRWRKDGKGYGSQKYFYKAILKYGFDKFKHEILYENLSKREACDVEIELINKCNTRNRDYGYNITAGGEGATGLKPMLGKSQSDETKLKISKANKGRVRIDLTELNNGNNHRGKLVYQFNNFGDLIGKYKSTREAERMTGIVHNLISASCTGKTLFGGGFIWSYDENYVIDRKYKTKLLPISQFDLNGNYLNTYSSAQSASKKYNIIPSRIIETCENKHRHIGGYVWKYA